MLLLSTQSVCPRMIEVVWWLLALVYVSHGLLDFSACLCLVIWTLPGSSTRNCIMTPERLLAIHVDFVVYWLFAPIRRDVDCFSSPLSVAKDARQQFTLTTNRVSIYCPVFWFRPLVSCLGYCRHNVVYRLFNLPSAWTHQFFILHKRYSNCFFFLLSKGL